MITKYSINTKKVKDKDANFPPNPKVKNVQQSRLGQRVNNLFKRITQRNRNKNSRPNTKKNNGTGNREDGVNTANPLIKKGTNI